MGLIADRLTETVALDCEMVGVGRSGKVLKLARVSLVNFHGDIVVDMYVRPNEQVTKYYPELNGITVDHMRIAECHDVVEQMMYKVLSDRIVVGHSLPSDLSVIFGHDSRALPPK